jgi:hypothetical protein
MPIAQSKRKLIAATALFIAVGSLTGVIATGGAATVSYAQQAGTQGGAQDGQQGGRIVREGTVTSSQDPLPGHDGHQRASILPLRTDGSIYTGVLTYTATEPVEVVVLNVQNLNATERSILNATDSEFGTLLTSQLNNQTSLVINIITPAYGDSPVPSASIPFAGNAVWLHTLDGTPFAASYAVSAQVVPAQTMNSISNFTAPVTEEAGDEGDDTDGGGAAGAATATATDAGDEGDEGDAGAADEAGADNATATATATDAGDET